jgi:hypothetical protein
MCCSPGNRTHSGEAEVAIHDWPLAAPRADVALFRLHTLLESLRDCVARDADQFRRRLSRCS